jgi:hypothetical protein
MDTICVGIQERVGCIEGGKEWGDGKGLWKMKLEKRFCEKKFGKNNDFVLNFSS